MSHEHVGHEHVGHEHVGHEHVEHECDYCNYRMSCTTSVVRKGRKILQYLTHNDFRCK